MKSLIAAILLMTLPHQAFAQERSVLHGVIEEMTKKYLEEATKSTAIKKLEEYASQKLSMELSGKLSSTLAFVSLVDSALQYDKAESETQRYQALSQTVSSGISLVAPPLGALVSLGVMTQGMMGALVSKGYSLALARLVNEISELEAKSSGLLLKQAETEKSRFANLIARSVAIETLIRENSISLEKKCSNDRTSVKEISICFQSSLLQRSLLKTYVNTMNKIAGFNGRFISVIAGLGQLEIDKINNVLQNAARHIEKVEASIQETTRYLAAVSALMVRNEIKEQYRYLACDRMLLSYTKKILKLRLQIEQRPDSAELLSFVIEDYQNDLKLLVTESCVDSFNLFDISAKSLIQSLLPIQEHTNKDHVRLLEAKPLRYLMADRRTAA